MAKLTLVGPTLARHDTRSVQPLPKVQAVHTQGARYLAWRDAVIAKAGGRCEAVTQTGARCLKAKPRHRVFADHIVEVTDGGALYDPDNGQCLCGTHHTRKTAVARAARRFT